MADLTTHLVFITPETRTQIVDPKRPTGRIFYVDAPANQTLCNTDREGDLKVTYLDVEHVDCLPCVEEARKRWHL